MYNFMVFLYLVLSVRGKIITAEIPETLKECMANLRKNCTEDQNITKEEYIAFEWNWDPKFMCYIQCALLNLNWVSRTYSPQFDVIQESLPTDFKPMVDLVRVNCHNVPDGFHECEKAYNFMRCFRDQNPEKWFLP